MLQHGHTVSSEFITDNTIPDSVKEIARQKFSIVEDHVHEAYKNE